MATLAAPLPALAAAEVVETGSTTYVVNTAKAEIDVTIHVSIKNNKPPTTTTVTCFVHYTCRETIAYYWNSTTVQVEAQAGALKATSNAGKVSQHVASTKADSRQITLTYPPVYYKQTRVLTLSYTIPAAPASPGGYRAGKAYADLCVNGNSVLADSGSVDVVVPDGFNVDFTAGTPLSKAGDANGLQTFGSGTVSEPAAFWACLEATDPAGLTSTSLTAGDQGFKIQAWPEDPAWASAVTADVQGDVQKLEDLTGLQMPGGTIAIDEAGGSQLADYAGSYAPDTETATVTENTDQATVAHELSHIWFNAKLFTATWMDEGFAGYSEKVAGTGNYKVCGAPGAYPGSGSADLTTWSFLDRNSSTLDQSITAWQYAASCYLVTQLADAIGPANFKAVLEAASKGEIAYVGASAPEASPLGGPPISPKALLDLIDERGMLPAGVTDLDRAQSLLGGYGIFTPDELAARSIARANYHKLESAAGSWKMPLAVRNPMAAWDFPTAQTAMDAVNQILQLRDQIQKSVPGVNLDGTSIQTQFQAASTEADLDALLTLTKKEADAAAKLGQAKQLNGGSRSIFQTIGLLGTDPAASIAQATTAIKNVKPDDASASAQQAIDDINGSAGQGMLRVGIVAGLLLALLAVVLFVWWRRRRRAGAAVAPLAGAAAWPYSPAAAYDPATFAPPAEPQGWPPAPPAPPVDPSYRALLAVPSLGRVLLACRSPGSPSRWSASW
jgi:hypothetical protein